MSRYRIRARSKRPLDTRSLIGDGRQWAGGETVMPFTLEISDELRERLDAHREEDESYEELIAELVSMYETGGAFLQEGYSE